MEKFEKQFEDLDVQSGVMENSMSNSVTTSVPQVSNWRTDWFDYLISVVDATNLYIYL